MTRCNKWYSSAAVNAVDEHSCKYFSANLSGIETELDLLIKSDSKKWKYFFVSEKLTEIEKGIPDKLTENVTDY